MPITRPPDKRLAYDIDGTIVGYKNQSTGAVAYLSKASKQALNDRTDSVVFDAGDGSVPPYWFFFIFPRPMTIAGLWGTCTRGTASIGSAVAFGAWGYSTDTINGIDDGTWTHLAGNVSGDIDSLTWAAHGMQKSSATEPEMWDEAYAFGSPVDNVKALRLYIRGGNTNAAIFRSAAIYGRPTTPSGLELWDPTLDEPADLGDLDWGTHDRLTQDTKQLRLKNTHSSLGFTGISLGFNDISGDSPAAGTNHRLSLDGVAWGTSISLPDLDPGEISDIFYVQRNTPSNAIIGAGAIYEVRLVPTFTGIS